jgi:prepilin-type N-terminal cleavage/methylation domain-containing protein
MYICYKLTGLWHILCYPASQDGRNVYPAGRRPNRRYSIRLVRTICHDRRRTSQKAERKNTMTGKLSQIRKTLREDKGFTLIEMAIVLIIIGIIIGAVVKGKDVVKSAEQKKLYTQFLREWQTAFNNYYDRTGWILGDTNTADNSGARDGHASTANSANLQSQLQRVGLSVPPAGPGGDPTVRTYVDSQGVQRTLTLRFAYNAGLGNFIRIQMMPSDLGMAWDRIVDGSQDGTAGDFLYTANIGAPATTAAWPQADTHNPTNNAAGILKLQF